MVGNSFGDLTFDREDVGQFSVKGIGPKMGIVGGFDQLHIHAHGVAAFLHTSFQDVARRQVAWRSQANFQACFVMLRGRVREITLRSAILAKRVRISS